LSDNLDQNFPQPHHHVVCRKKDRNHRPAPGILCLGGSGKQLIVLLAICALEQILGIPMNFTAINANSIRPTRSPFWELPEALDSRCRFS
jgi:hypothetical protein